MLAAGFVRAHETVAAEHDAVRHDFALRDRRAEAPGGGNEHLAVGGFAQAAARGARGDERLHQHRHRGAGGIEPVLRHRSPRGCGPQRRPAGAQAGEEFAVVAHAEKALELAGEIRFRAILDQRRGAHRRRLVRRPPRRENVGEQVRREIALIEFQPDLDREPALRRLIGVRIGGDRIGEFEMLDLPPVGIGRDAKSARRRQAGLRQRRKVRRLRPDAVRRGRGGGGEGEDETHRTKLVGPSRRALPLPACGER